MFHEFKDLSQVDGVPIRARDTQEATSLRDSMRDAGKAELLISSHDMDVSSHAVYGKIPTSDKQGELWPISGFR